MKLATEVARDHARESSSAIIEHIAAELHIICPMAPHSAIIEKIDALLESNDRTPLIAFCIALGQLVGRVQTHKNPGNRNRVHKLLGYTPPKE